MYYINKYTMAFFQRRLGSLNSGTFLTLAFLITHE